MTIPEESKLIWSSEKPTFEDVKGKHCVVQDKSGNISDPHYEMWETQYKMWFGRDFLRYAILDLSKPLEAKELWGVAPRMHQDADKIWYFSYAGNGYQIVTPSYPTEAEAITAWNQLVDKIEGEK